jgi:hypothetical protein
VSIDVGLAMMDVGASIAPRLRMSRHSPVQYGSSSITSNTSGAGPSRLPSFSQILDLDMNDIPLSDDQFSPNDQSTPKNTTTPTPPRSENPAAVLRALLSRLPAHPPSPTKSSIEQEPEFDFDSVSESNTAPRIAQESPKPIPLVQGNGIDSTPPQNKGSRRLKNGFKTPSPPKGLPDLPTPSSSDESENRSYGNIQSVSKWAATPKPPGGWLNTPKRSREVTEQESPSDDATERNSDSPVADEALSYLKPPGGWLKTPKPSREITEQESPSDDATQRNSDTPAPVDNGLSYLKTPAAPGAWLGTPAVKKSILKVRFEPEVSTFTDKSESGKHSDPFFDSSISAVNSLDNSNDGLQRTEQLSSTSPPSSRGQKSLKSPKIRLLDAFGREQDPDESHLEESEDPATLSHFNFSRGELLSRIRNGLDDLNVGIDDLDK